MAYYGSWGKIFNYRHKVIKLGSRYATLPLVNRSLLPYGLGRSYGDSCLSGDGNVLIDTSNLDRFISFNRQTGVLQAESGLAIADILNIIVSSGWFLPVTPGTKYVTLGGAVANDVHGKNHHLAGSFGHHVLRFELLRSSGERLICSSESHPQLFNATIGGLGLTGLITWVEIQLVKIVGETVDQELIRFQSLRDFYEISQDSLSYDYTVAWIDSLAPRSQLGRGIFMRANHPNEALTRLSCRKDKTKQWQVPLDAPNFFLNHMSLKIFNSLYFHKPIPVGISVPVSFDSFFYPLDAVGHWNRIYGKRGFYQYQCVIPDENASDAVTAILTTMHKFKQGSFLAILKVFGDKPGLGMLSFARAGVTLALDFPNLGERTLRLFHDLDRIVLDAKGALYPAKDARMPPEVFQKGFPRIEEFLKLRDPVFSSSFIKRMGY